MNAVVAAASVAVIGVGAYTCYVEATPYFSSYASDIQRLDNIDAGDARPGFSSESVDFALDECLWGTTSLFGRLQGSAERSALLSTCDAIVDHVLAARPTDAYGWYIKAVVSDARGNADAVNAGLSRSTQFGPDLQWLVQRRVPLAEDHLATLDQEARDAHRSDLSILVRSQSGIRSIAQRYVADADFRARIADIVETLPEADQQRFVEYVQDEAAKLTAQRAAGGGGAAP